MNKNKIDNRKIGKEAQQQLRYLVINLILEKIPRYKITKATGVSLSAIAKYWKIYKKFGLNGLTLKKRGPKTWNNSKLTKDQITKLMETLTECTPSVFDLSYCLWSRQSIQDLIYKFWKIYVPLRTITDYMKKLNFTAQKPIKRAYQQNPKNIKKWLEEDYPNIVKRAYKENSEIHWLDETAIFSNSNYLRGFSPKGKTPIIQMKAKYIKINIISFITNKRKMRFLSSKKFINTDKLIEFTEGLCKEIDHKVFLILDNASTHRSKIFTSWLKNNKNNIEVFYLPPYSPELNPDERLNRDLKTHFHACPISKNEKEFMNKLILFLIEIQEDPERVKVYFKSKFVQYAA